MYQLIKPLLFSLAPERAHHLTVALSRLTFGTPIIRGVFRSLYGSPKKKSLERHLMGLHFKNPVGLAAGFDKDGKYFNTMANLGFGFIEIGTVTPKPQGGNPQPRLFRLKKDKAIINRMGFNNEGVEALVERLKKGKPENVIIGGNIGKNKATPNQKATDDYVYSFEKLFPYVDYFVVNVSSPNTPGLRDLQEKEPLTKLLTHLQALNQAKPASKPILLKIAPDLTDSQLDDILEIVATTKIDGIIATNTTIDRSGLQESAASVEKIGNGGLSGQPLTKRSTEVIRYLYNKSGKQLLIIGVGGIASPEDALEKINAGAALVQIYTGLIYEGPTLVKKINAAIAKAGI